MRINSTIIIKKNNTNNYYLFLQDKSGEDIFINGNIARLELTKSLPIIHTLNDQIGTLQFAPSKKELRFIITRYAGESQTYKMGKQQKGVAFGSEFGYWEIEKVNQEHLDYLLETIYYNLKQDIIKNIKDYKDFLRSPSLKKAQKQSYLLQANSSNMNIGGWFESEKDKQEYEDNYALLLKYEEDIKINQEKLKELYQWELDREQAYRKSSRIWLTNPQHVKDLKEKIRMLGVEIKGELYSQVKQQK